MEPVKLTDAQFETLDTLRCRHIVDDESPFYPREIFPARDNLDNGHRRTVDSLVRKGLIERRQSDGMYVPHKEACIDALIAYKLNHNLD